MKIEQYVMAYGVEHDRLRAVLPEGFSSLRPVLRINAEIRNDSNGYVEFNTAVEKDGRRGWLNIGYWDDVSFVRDGKNVTFRTDFLEISFKGTGLEGGCPAEADDEGCYFLDESSDGGLRLRNHEVISTNKEFCDCTFAWHFGSGDAGSNAHGKSIGKTLSATFEEIKTIYPKQPFTVENAAAIPCRQVLGSYVVCFERQAGR